MNWLSNVNEIAKHLKRLSAVDSKTKGMPIDEALDLWIDLALSIREKQKTIFLIGNGASASMASHVAADLAKNGQVHTEVFSDLSLITAIANDISYEEVFAEPLRRRMREGDMLVAISSSGQSMNVLKAAEEAKKRGGTLVTLSAMRPDNSLHSKGLINFYVPAMTYGLAETCHAAILHYWIDKIVERNSTVNK
jgi:D-sedoheptulose 7-phosphate isomerase